MKNINKLASLILAALLLCLSVFGVSAAEIIGETLDVIITGGEEEQEELTPMRAGDCYDDGDTYGTHAWESLDAALAYYNMPISSVHECNVTHNGIHYSCYVQMNSFRIYVRLA